MLTLDQAQAVLAGGLAHARARNMPPMTIAVLDARGCIVAMAAEDGSSLLRDRIAYAKAHGALGLGAGSRSFVAKAEAHPNFFTALNAISDAGVVPVPGGVLIRSDSGAIIGAAGVSGFMPDADEACAVAGIEATGLSPDTGDEG